jgi:lipopolysaccharide export LptBFGC system permease protein LptF
MTAPDDFTAAPDPARQRPGAERSAAQLLSDLADETSVLVRQELALFRTELGRNLARAGHAVVALAVGAVIVFSAWCALLAAATLGLCTFLAPWLAALVIALANLTTGAGLLYFARRRLGLRSFALRRTVRSLREDASWLKDRVR